MLDSWDSQAANEIVALRNAVRKRIDTVIIRPGIVDSPAGADTPLGSFLLQYQKFGFATYNRIGRNLPNKESAEILSHITSALFIGIATSKLKDIVNGKEVEFDPVTSIYESIHRSGFLGYMSNMLDLTDRLGIGPGAIIGAETFSTSKFGQQRPLSPIAGPSLSTFEKAQRTLGNPTFKNVSSLLPFQNLATIRAVVTAATAAKNLVDPEE